MRCRRGWAISLALGAFMGLVACGGDEANTGPSDRTPGEGPKPPSSNRDGALAAFNKLIATPEWSLSLRPRRLHEGMEAVHKKTGLAFVLIPAGSFQMGSSPRSEYGHGPGERQHLVSFQRPFLLCKTECTQRAWEKGGGQNESRFRGADHPVEQVSWEDCHDWCSRNGLRLPSESEWEYACRAGTTTPFSFGPSISTRQVNFDGNFPYTDSAKGEFRDRTVVAGSLPANPWGLCDMHGNVLEWCEDWYSLAYSNAPHDGSPCTDPWKDEVWERGPYRIMRGGCYKSHAQGCRSAFRGRVPSSNRQPELGFRPAADLPE